MNLTITGMKELNKEAGQHWFDKDTMRFFDSKIEAGPNKKDIFITSETIGTRTCQRGYSLRQFDRETGKVETIGEMNDYSTLKEAREARKQL